MEGKQGKLWDAEPVQDTTAEPEQGQETRESALELLRQVREQRKQLNGTGRYVLLPTEALTLRAEAYYYQYVEDVIRLLVSSGVTDTDTVNTVIQDYFHTLMGLYEIIALPLHEQIRVCNAVKPWRVFLTEKYGLNLLFTLYFYNLRTATDYLKGFKILNYTDKGENAEITEEIAEKKRKYIDTHINRFASGTAPMLAFGYSWFRKKLWEQDGKKLQIVEPSDFSGVEPELANKYFAYIEVFSGVDEYLNYYYIAKFALNATPDELKEIDSPPVLGTPEQAREYAERFAKQRYKNLQRKASDFEKMIDAETVEDIKKAQQEITEPAEPQDTIRIPETFALLGSRDVYASVDGTPQMGKGILPIQAFITDYMTRHHLTEQVTPRTVEKVIEGINLLQRLYNVKPNEKGQYTFETNLSEFSELLGYKDANQTQKLEIMRALQVLDGLYLAVWRSDGLKAVRVFTIQEIGITGVYSGKLTLQVNADTMKGRPNLISYRDFNNMRKDAKGQAETHFRYQIIGKGQKEENALLNEVFGYEVLLNEIQASGGSAEDIAKAKRNIDKHKSRDKRRLSKMFEEWRGKGWLEWYTYTRNGKGEYIYKWRRGNIPKDVFPTPPPQEPDEQTQP